MVYGPIKKPKNKIERPVEYYHYILDKYGEGVWAAIYVNDHSGKQVFKDEWTGDGTLSRNKKGQFFFTPYY